MKILLAGAFGNLGSDILRALCATEHEIIAAGATPRAFDDLDGGRFVTRQIDVTRPETLTGLCDGVDVVITTVGLTKASTRSDNYAIDYRGNLNLLNEAKRAGVKQFDYISVIHADRGRGVPMVHSKYMMEQALIQSGLNYVIYRPTGFFYDIAKVFIPMVEKGEVQLLKRRPEPACNVVDTADFADFILGTMCEPNRLYSVGGCETYTYRQIAEMFFKAAGKQGKIRTVPPFVMSILSNLPKIRKQGRRDVILFSKFTLTNDCVGDTVIGKRSFREYIGRREYLDRYRKTRIDGGLKT